MISYANESHSASITRARQKAQAQREAARHFAAAVLILHHKCGLLPSTTASLARDVIDMFTEARDLEALAVDLEALDLEATR